MNAWRDVVGALTNPEAEPLPVALAAVGSAVVFAAVLIILIGMAS